MPDYNQFVTAVNKIYDYISKMKVGWNSQDNLNYIESIEEYKSAVIGHADVFKTPAPPIESTKETAEKKEEKPQENSAPQAAPEKLQENSTPQPVTEKLQESSAPQQPAVQIPQVTQQAAPQPAPQQQSPIPAVQQIPQIQQQAPTPVTETAVTPANLSQNVEALGND